MKERQKEGEPSSARLCCYIEISDIRDGCVFMAQAGFPSSALLLSSVSTSMSQSILLISDICTRKNGGYTGT